MNIIKIQNQLKGVPDDTLVGYVQNPTGQVPTYLALSELQRRKEMRNSYQANKPEEKTVAEDLVQEAQPQPQPQMEGLAGLPEAQPMMQAMAPPPEMPMQQMAQGGLAELDTGDMFDENNYATGGIVAFDEGGEVQHFVKGGMPDEYGVIMPTVPTLDDMIMQTREAQEAFGVDPDFYKKTLEESKTERLKELADAKKMDQAQLLLAMGSAFAGTPTFGKALSVAGERAVPIIGAIGKNQREINSIYKMADRKSLEAQYAQSRGDAAGAQKAIIEKENLLLTAQLKEAELKSAEGIASTKSKATIAGKEKDTNIKIGKLAEDMFVNSFPSGAASGVFLSNPGFLQFVKNIYLENAMNFADSRTMPPIPAESQLLDMFNKFKAGNGKAAVKPASKLSGEDSPLAATRPSMPLLDKYPKTGSRSRNTAEELRLTDPIYDNMGSQDDYLQ
jgi:hypothetical protein